MWMSMNIVILTGRLTRDPEIKYTQSSKAFAKFSIAVQQTYKNEKGEYGADFINCVAWDKRAETIGEYLRKGSNVGIQGRLSVRSYEDENKQKRTITEVVVESFEFLDSKKSRGDSGESDYSGGSSNNEAASGDDEFPF